MRLSVPYTGFLLGLSLAVVPQHRAVADDGSGPVPTFSMAVSEINSVPVVGDDAAEMTVSPGDVVTVHIYIRNWSPSGEQAAALQAELNPTSFDSGDTGSIKPVAYDVTTLRGEPNDKNAFVDIKNQKFIHYGRHALAFVQTNTVDPGYRWISVVVARTGPTAKQDDKKYYFGTVKLYVSDDATGTFEIAFMEGVEQTTMRTPQAELVEPIHAESLTLHVDPSQAPDPCWITGSTPAYESIDARAPHGRLRKPWDVVELRMSCDASGLSADDFVLADHAESPPIVKSVGTHGRVVTIQLSKPITANQWTRVEHKPSGTYTRIGRLQGDVNGDGWCDSDDVHYLIRLLNNGALMPNYHNDVDGNNVVDAADLTTLLRLFASEEVRRLPAR